MSNDHESMHSNGVEFWIELFHTNVIWNRTPNEKYTCFYPRTVEIKFNIYFLPQLNILKNWKEEMFSIYSGIFRGYWVIFYEKVFYF